MCSRQAHAGSDLTLRLQCIGGAWCELGDGETRNENERLAHWQYSAGTMDLQSQEPNTRVEWNLWNLS